MSNESKSLFAIFSEEEDFRPYMNLTSFSNAWARQDDEIERYVEDDDEPYTMGGMSGGPLILLVVILSAVFGALIFYFSYRQEQTGSCCFREETSEDDAEEQVLLRSGQDIERGLKLKKWENIRNFFDDEETRRSSSSEEEETEHNEEIFEDCDFCSVTSEMSESDHISQISDISSSGSAASSGQSTSFMEDPAFVRLQQKPRCILCSKFFQDSDFVTESWEPSCHHHFHKECIVPWLQKNHGCPVCKQAYLVGLADSAALCVPVAAPADNNEEESTEQLEEEGESSNEEEPRTPEDMA